MINLPSHVFCPLLVVVEPLATYSSFYSHTGVSHSTNIKPGKDISTYQIERRWRCCHKATVRARKDSFPGELLVLWSSMMSTNWVTLIALNTVTNSEAEESSHSITNSATTRTVMTGDKRGKAMSATPLDVFLVLIESLIYSTDRIPGL